jgi:thiamine-phosphate pyrophosphorylase
LPASHSKPVLCYVTNLKSLGASRTPEDLLERIKSALIAGVDWIQIREKNLSGRELVKLAREAVSLARSSASAAQARILINDRLDVAVAAGAGGVHLGRESLPAKEVVRWRRAGNAPSGFLVGVSCHNLEEAKIAEADGADYIFFGPVFDSPEKRQYGEPHGPARLKEVCAAIGIPVIAIGGINLENSKVCLEAGAAGIAAIRMFQEAVDFSATREMIERLREIG